MKKLIIILACALLLCACGNKETITVTDGDTVVLEVKGDKFTKNDLFNRMKGMAGTDVALTSLKLKLADLENIDLSTLEQEATEYVDYIGSYGEDYIEYYGGEEVIKYSYIASAIDSEFVKEHVSRHLEDYVADYAPFYSQFVSFEDEETANKFLDAIDAGTAFEQAATDLELQYDPALYVYTNRDSLPEEIKQYCEGKTEPFLSEIIPGSTESTDDDGNPITKEIYYVINVASYDVNDFKNEFLQYIANGSYVDPSIALNEMFKVHDINIYDEEIYNNLTQVYGALVK